jgi:hypothetical protein
MTSVAHYEPAVERVNRTCVARLREWAEKGEVDVDVPELMQKYACDVIGEITVSTVGCLVVALWICAF